jgi:LuxR family maltose regulon positive regulatory protein
VDEATMDLRRATGLVTKLQDAAAWYRAEVHIALAQAALRLSDVPGAQGLLSAAAPILRRMPQTPTLERWVKDLEVRIESAGSGATGDRWSLTTAELRVLQFLPTHHSIPQIARRLNVSSNTVKTHARAIYRKLDASSRAEAVARALSAGLVEGGAPRLPAGRPGPV